MTHLPCPDESIARYTCYHISQPLQIDGSLSKPSWLSAPKSHRFVDMASGTPGYFDTRMAALWDDTNLYIGFWVEEPSVEAYLQARDSLIFQENDVEVFIDGGDCYYELEINALATIYEVMFIWRDAYRRGSRFDVPEFDLFERDVYGFAGNDDRGLATFWRGTHPRGARWAFTDWDFPGLQVAVQVQGSINDPSTIDQGWTVEIALPWAGMTWLANGRPLPPNNGDVWRMFFARFQKLINAGKEIDPHPAWVLSPHGIYDSHQPECFPYMEFSTTDVNSREGDG